MVYYAQRVAPGKYVGNSCNDPAVIVSFPEGRVAVRAIFGPAHPLFWTTSTLIRPALPDHVFKTCMQPHTQFLLQKGALCDLHE